MLGAMPTPLPAAGFYTTEQVAALTTFHRTTLWRMSKDGLFPAPRKLTSGGKLGWPRQAVDDWIRSKTEAAALPEAA